MASLIGHISGGGRRRGQSDRGIFYACRCPTMLEMRTCTLSVVAWWCRGLNVVDDGPTNCCCPYAGAAHL